MIVKKIANPHKSASRRVRIGRLADYIESPETGAVAGRATDADRAKANRVAGLADYAGRAAADDSREKCVYGGARGLMALDRDDRKAEMLALARRAVRSKDPIGHYVLSWRQGERPTPAQVEEAVDIFLDELGLADHQAIYGLHADTDNLHLHLMVNRVHPETCRLMLPNKGGRDLEAAHRAIARIERAQGWTREARGRYRVADDGTLRRDRHPPPDPAATATRRARDRWPHRHGGATSAARIAAETGAPSIRKAASWAELHARLAARGLRYEREGSGALLRVGEVAVKASSAGRDCGLPALERRLGPYRPAPAELAVAARADPGAERRAEARARRAAWTAERAALGAAHREQRDALWRSVPPGGWRGRGAELNAGRSLLAARQAGERAALLERQRRERALARALRDADVPGAASEVAERAGPPDRRRARLVALIVLEEEAAARPRDIRDFVAVICGRQVDYRRADDPDGPAGFADRGGEIAVHAERDRDTVRAALQLAAQKWGRFRVEGDAEYRALCVRVAAECGLPLGEPEPLEAPRWPGPAAGHRTGPAP